MMAIPLPLHSQRLKGLTTAVNATGTPDRHNTFSWLFIFLRQKKSYAALPLVGCLSSLSYRLQGQPPPFGQLLCPSARFIHSRLCLLHSWTLPQSTRCLLFVLAARADGCVTGFCWHNTNAYWHPTQKPYTVRVAFCFGNPYLPAPSIGARYVATFRLCCIPLRLTARVVTGLCCQIAFL